jgi:hypothetical protein
MPLSVALDSDAVAHTQAAALKFGPQIYRSEACRYACGGTGARAADGACGTIREHECITDGTGTSPEWLARRPPLGGVFIAATTSWLPSCHHSSAADGKACGPRGLWRS